MILMNNRKFIKILIYSTNLRIIILLYVLNVELKINKIEKCLIEFPNTIKVLFE